MPRCLDALVLCGTSAFPHCHRTYLHQNTSHQHTTTTVRTAKFSSTQLHSHTSPNPLPPLSTLRASPLPYLAQLQQHSSPSTTIRTAKIRPCQPSHCHLPILNARLSTTASTASLFTARKSTTFKGSVHQQTTSAYNLAVHHQQGKEAHRPNQQG